jgi:hypothetical protein
MMILSYIPEGICFAAFVVFVARGYTMQRSRFLQEYKSESSYIPEDGHAGRNM